MKRNIYAFIAMLLLTACEATLPPNPSPGYENEAVSIPFTCYYLGVVVLEGYLMIDEESANKYNVEDYLSGNVSCESEYIQNLTCRMSY